MGIMLLHFGISAIRSIGTPQNNVSASVINLLGEIDVNGQQTNVAKIIN